MSFALTKFKAWGVNVGSPIRKHDMQYAELHITGTVADVDLDIGDDSGTFWTDALADSTYGSLATTALDKLQKIVAIANSLMAVESQEITLVRLRAAAAAGTDYALAIQDKRPNFIFDANQGETSYIIKLEWSLKDGLPAVIADLGTTV